uniref:Uncharacterized protein n=1 Tax=Glossina brevipalpis TaxID=37001 RepID=A0A1A9WA52_9MUSC
MVPGARLVIISIPTVQLLSSLGHHHYSHRYTFTVTKIMLLGPLNMWHLKFNMNNLTLNDNRLRQLIVCVECLLLVLTAVPLVIHNNGTNAKMFYEIASVVGFSSIFPLFNVLLVIYERLKMNWFLKMSEHCQHKHHSEYRLLQNE